MSSKTARTHSHVSNRARNKSEGDRKVVFKGVLDNPFRIQPAVTSNAQKDVLAAILTQLAPVTDYQTYRKRKRMSTQQEARKKRKQETDAGPSEGTMDANHSLSEADISPAPDRPHVLNHLIVGINEVTKRLEEQIRSQRVTLITTNTSPNEPTPPLRLILVCRADLNPPMLVDHLPHLVAAYNSLRPEEPIQLVPLATGAELRLSQAVGLRRAAVLGLDDSMGVIPTLSAAWLSSVPIDKFVPTHIKQVRTSAPKDLKGEKQRRKEEKTMKKDKRKLSKNNIEIV
ncbi:hypothetical protein H0H87_012409 [Tephrocybe sp. NHM501043]|nr:hypothetical protein H0H87_012409 [Tephrocybe sp. NHM501043]